METRKVLGQSNPPGGALTNIYTVPASTQAVVSNVTVCNQGTVATSFRLSVAVNSAADASSQYLYVDHPLNGTDTFAARLGIGLGAGDVVRGYCQNGNCSISVFGVEIT